MKLLIAIPALDFMSTAFVKALQGLTEQLHRDGVPFEVDIQTGTLVYFGRDRLARRAVNEGFTRVLWLDSDMVFAPTIYDELTFCGAPFVTAVAVSRREPFASCIFEKIAPEPVRFDVKQLPREPFEVAGCGLACALTETTILREVLQAEGTAFFPTQKFGEDVAFCDRARRLGHRIVCDPHVRVGHIGHIAVYPDDAERWKA